MRLLIALLLIVLTLPAHAMSPMMLLAGAKAYNTYDFESSANGWSLSNFTRADISPNAYSGSSAMQTVGLTLSDLTLTDSHGAGTVSVWARQSGITTSTIAIGNGTGYCLSPTALTNVWTKYSCTIAAGQSIIISVDNTAASFSAWVDYIRIPK